MKYGTLPMDLGLVDISPTEMMFWLYCPIKAPFGPVWAPDTLRQFDQIHEKVYRTMVDGGEGARWAESYVYMTAKTLWVTPENPGNRRGWHSDGFLTDDLNFIWSDTNGTLFWDAPELVGFTPDHNESLGEMEALAEPGPHVVYPDKHLLRLDESVIHRVADFERPGMRTFVKLSISRHEYRLKGNSVNHILGLNWTYEDRKAERNTPEVPSPPKEEE